MFQKRKKFKGESTPEVRLADRWDQQVFFITRKFPDSQPKISEIVNSHASLQGNEFQPSEEALNDLANLWTSLRSPS